MIQSLNREAVNASHQNTPSAGATKLPPITCQGFAQHEFSRGKATGYYDRAGRWHSTQEELIETPPQEIQSDMLGLLGEAKENSRELYEEVRSKKAARREGLRQQRAGRVRNGIRAR